MSERVLNVAVVAYAWPPTLTLSVLRPLAALEATGSVRLRVTDPRILKIAQHDLAWADVVVVCRAQSTHELAATRLARELGKVVISEIDDDFFTIPLSTPLGQHHRAAVNLFRQAEIYALSHLTRTFNPLMSQQVRNYGGRPVQIVSYFDVDLAQVAPAPANDGRVHIAYATARLDGPEFLFFQVAIERIAERFGDAVRIHVWRPPSGLLARASNVVVHPLVPSYETFVRDFVALAPHIGLAPIPQHPFYSAKTDNKYREYGGARCAGIYSDVEPYRSVITQDTNGLLVENSTDLWVDAIARLIENESVRSEIASAAHADVIERYSFAQAVDTWQENLDRATTTAAPPVPPGLGTARDVLLVGPDQLMGDDDEIEARAANKLAYLMKRAAIDAAREIGLRLTKTSFELVAEGVLPGSFQCALFVPETVDDLAGMVASATQFRSAVIDVSLLHDQDLDLAEFVSSTESIRWIVPKQMVSPCAVMSVDIDTSATVSRYTLHGHLGAYLGVFSEVYGRGTSVARGRFGRLHDVASVARRGFDSAAQAAHYGARLVGWRFGSRKV